MVQVDSVRHAEGGSAVAIQLGIALEGGGARCAAQVGALLTLFDMGIRPTLYAGCGAGALVASLAACGLLSEEQVDSFARAVQRNSLLRGRAINHRLSALFGGMPMREVPPLAMPAIDMESGAVQVLSSMLPVRPDPRPWSRQALVSGAVRASMAAPGVLSPVRWRGRRLSGGGALRGTLPTILRSMGAERVVCIRVLDAGCALHETHPAAQALCGHAMIAMPPPPQCDMLITVNGYAPERGVLDRRTLPVLLEAGRHAAMKALPALETLIGGKAGKILLFPGMEN